MTRTHTASTRRFAPALLGLALITCTLGGCYERVVRAKGFGADQYNVAEPYQESGQLDEWIFGSDIHEGKRNNTLLPQ
jgi:hypothetical protein